MILSGVELCGTLTCVPSMYIFLAFPSYVHTPAYHLFGSIRFSAVTVALAQKSKLILPVVLKYACGVELLLGLLSVPSVVPVNPHSKPPRVVKLNPQEKWRDVRRKPPLSGTIIRVAHYCCAPNKNIISFLKPSSYKHLL